ncbi:hypothetical protein [Umezawaea tangerina]|nr:hypothetical protein [Umezawaea tangerina]
MVFTQAPDVFGNGVADFLRSTEGLVLPWEQAVHERFDLGLAAAYGGLGQLHAPLVVMPHGAGYGKSYGDDGARFAYGLDAQRLTHNGKVIASALVLAHYDELDVLRRQCPRAVGNAVVAGDPCYDRVVASLPHRPAYRQALGVGLDGRLLVVSSTWGSGSLFGRSAELLPRILAELTPLGYTVAALLHPAVWFGHSPRQIKAWLADCRDAGLVLVTPDVDWRAAVVAADQVIADHGSVGVYAAAIGRPLILTEPSVRSVSTAGSAQDLLQDKAPRLVADIPIEEQFRAARSGAELLAGRISERLTSCPGRSAAELRRAMYRLLELPEPGRHRAVTPVPVPPREMW